jgi:hypothetical protein
MKAEEIMWTRVAPRKRKLPVRRKASSPVGFSIALKTKTTF